MKQIEEKVLIKDDHHGNPRRFFKTRFLKSLKAETHRIHVGVGKFKESKPMIVGEQVYSDVSSCRVLSEKDAEVSTSFLKRTGELRIVINAIEAERQKFLVGAWKRSPALKVEKFKTIGKDDGSIPGLEKYLGAA